MNPQTPLGPPPSGEQPRQASPEHMPTPIEQSAGMAPGEESAAQPSSAVPLSPQDVAAAIAKMPSPAAPTPTVIAPPQIAEDVDVIEKEWVDQAEAIIEAKAGDPHGEEEAVENLQVDYMQKRFGHTVKRSDSDEKPAA